MILQGQCKHIHQKSMWCPPCYGPKRKQAIKSTRRFEWHSSKIPVFTQNEEDFLKTTLSLILVHHCRVGRPSALVAQRHHGRQRKWVQGGHKYRQKYCWIFFSIFVVANILSKNWVSQFSFYHYWCHKVSTRRSPRRRTRPLRWRWVGKIINDFITGW